MLGMWCSGLSVKNLILHAIWKAFTASFLQKIVVFLCCEHVFLDQERYVLFRDINGTATSSSVPRRGPQLWGLRLMGQLKWWIFDFCLHSGTTASTSSLDKPVTLCISFCRDTSQKMSFLQDMHVYALEFEDVLSGLCLQFTITIVHYFRVFLTWNRIILTSSITSWSIENWAFYLSLNRNWLKDSANSDGTCL